MAQPSSVPSITSLSVASMTSSFAQLQSVERPEEFIATKTKPYRCHLISKSTIEKSKDLDKSLADDDNNLLAASWLFHQYLDGSNVEDECTGLSLPQIAESRDFKEEIVGDPPFKRKQVELSVQCRDDDIAKVIGQRLKNGSESKSKKEWKIFVHVTDPQLFCDCLEWKYEDTVKKWKDADGAIDDL